MRYFVSFKPNTTLSNKLMVFTDVHRTDVQSAVQAMYPDMWHRIYTEQEAASLLSSIYRNAQWIPYGTVCKFTNEVHQVSLKPITEWFKIAKPEPLNGFPEKWLTTQLAAHFEEIAEMLEGLYGNDMPDVAIEAYNAISALSDYLYSSSEFTINNKVGVLDALADQIVTATGVAYFSKFKLDEALTEVNNSNFSKFVDGKPILNENGKIIKGKHYFKPRLDDYV